MQTERTIPELTKDIAGQLGDLFRNEVRLARAETMDNVRDMGAGLMRLAFGVVLAGAAATLGLFALAYGLAEVMPMWGAALTAALIGAIIAYMLVNTGRKALSPDNLALPRTARQVSRDLQLLKENVPS